MAKKKEGAKGKEEGGGKKKMIIMVVVVAVAFLAGSKLMGGGGTAAAGVAVPTTIPEGEVKSLDPITLNLADGRLLKIGIALQMKYDPTPAAAGGEGAAPATGDPTKGYARALDVVIDVMSHHTMAELVKPDVRDEAKKMLVDKLNVAYKDEIEDVYFYEFVMQ